MNLKRKTKKGINLTSTILIIVGILILLNYISSNIFFRVDMTQTKEYSISETTKETLKGLDDIINIKGFFSKEIPAEMLIKKQEVQDIIEEYRNYANGKLRVTYVDPKDDEKIKQEAGNLGIPELSFSDLQKDKYQVSTGYLGLAVLYGDKKEIIPVVAENENLEYELTSAIKKALQKENPRIGVVKNNNEENLRSVNQLLSQLYDVTTIDLADGNLIPENISTLIIPGYKDELNERQKYILDQFLMQGKSLLVLQESYYTDGKTLIPVKNKSGLDNLLASYGIELKDNLVLDQISEAVPFSDGYQAFIKKYPFWPKIERQGFNKDNVIVNQLESITFPWVSSVEFSKNKVENPEIINLISTSQKSWLQDSPSNLNPQQQFQPSNEAANPVALYVAGKFTSSFKDKDKPKGKGATEEKNFIPETAHARIIVVGDSDFITDGFLDRFKSNAIFFQNAVDALTSDEALIKIRSKAISDRPIKEVSDRIKESIKFFNIFGITIIVLLIGLIRYYLRKRTKFSDQI